MSNEKKLEKICKNCFCEKGDVKICPNCSYDESQPTRGEILPPGTMLNGKYMIGRVLGRGGFGITYYAINITKDEKLAIKEYYPIEFCTRTSESKNIYSLSSKKSSLYNYGLKSFLEEAKTMARFNSDCNIVSVKSFFKENNSAYFVMEYLDGMTLKQYLESKEKTISWEETKDLITPVIEGLKNIHSQGIIHRDIAPDNIMVLKDGSVKILDFGNARFAFSDKSHSLTVAFKPGFTPLEQYSSKGNQGPWTDVYSLAATIYVCLTGIKPDIPVERVVKDKLKAPIDMNVSIPRSVNNALMKALSIKVEDRYRSIDEFISNLKKQKKNNKKVMISAIAMVVVVILLVIVFNEQYNNTEQTGNVEASKTSVDIEEPKQNTKLETRETIIENGQELVNDKNQIITDETLRYIIDDMNEENRVLEISDLNIKDLTGIDKLENIESVHFSYDYICSKDNNFFYECIDRNLFDGMTIYIDLLNANYQESQLEKIDVLDGIQIKNINQKQAEEITAYAKSRGLTHLHFGSMSPEYSNDIADISFLENYNELENIAIYGVGELDNLDTLATLSKLKTLSLTGISGKGIVKLAEIGDIDFLNGLANLETIVLGFANISDISIISEFKSLKTLMLVVCPQINDYSAIGKLKYLKKLSISSYPTTTLGTTVDDISFIENMRDLEMLEISNSYELADISAISGLTNIIELNLEGCNNISDISALSGLMSLEKLNLRYCPKIKDFSFISKMNKLEVLKIGGESFDILELDDILFINDCSSLSELEISNSGVFDISSLSELSKLENLNLKGSVNLYNINTLADLKELKVVNFNYCDNISNLEPLTRLNKLESLYLYGTNISNINPIENLPMLKNLNIENCDKLEDLDTIENLKQLESLNISGLDINYIGFLKSLKSIKDLKLSFCNEIEDFNPLKKLIGVESIDLSGTEIDSLDVLSGLRDLKDIDISHCENIDNLEPLITLSVEKLDIISCPNIADISLIYGLKDLKELKLGCFNGVYSLTIDGEKIVGSLNNLNSLTIYNSEIIDSEELEVINNLWIY